MRRSFNTTGPCDPARHYMLPAERRLPDLLELVEEQLYFVLHAARQTGKTTAMRAFAARLRGLGYVAVWATLETSQGFSEVDIAERLWMSSLSEAARQSLPPDQTPPPPEDFYTLPEGERLRRWLRRWSEQVGPAPVVLLLDEADVVRGQALVSLLRQLRAGFMDRGPGCFPISVGLIGMRDLRDYLTQAKDGQAPNPGSPFNVKAASLTLRAFTLDEVGELYAQHQADTGQIFTPEAAERVFYWSAGHPFLVCALARIAVRELCPDPAQPITAETIDLAKERLIQSRTTHLDALGERLKEPRVARVIQPVLLADNALTIDYASDDFQYVQDLGLVRRGPDGAEIFCPLYREVLARELSWRVQEALPRPRWRWQRPDGGLDMEALVASFLQWWRENADIVAQHAQEGYLEAVPHLAFMGFLQRVVNGGGTIHREFSANRGRVDLVVLYQGERFVIELKRVPPRHRTLERVRAEGVEQLLGYLDSLGEREGWLIIFDQRPDRSWEDRLWSEELSQEGRALHLRGG